MFKITVLVSYLGYQLIIIFNLVSWSAYYIKKGAALSATPRPVLKNTDYLIRMNFSPITGKRYV